jgi:hypothetical protein
LAIQRTKLFNRTAGTSGKRSTPEEEKRPSKLLPGRSAFAFLPSGAPLAQISGIVTPILRPHAPGKQSIAAQRAIRQQFSAALSVQSRKKRERKVQHRTLEQQSTGTNSKQNYTSRTLISNSNNSE